MAPWRTAFSFSLPHRLVDNPLLLTIGRFDGRHPSLVAATTPTQLLIHSTTQTAGGGVSLLNVGESVTCVDAGRLHPTLGRDWLLIGTAQQLRVYDVHENQDIFTVEVSDGASVVRCLPIAGHPAEGGNVLAIVGGNCSVLGFDDTGVEVFWTVTGDTVRTMAAGRVTANDAKPTSKLLIGTDDYAIRVYEREEALHEIAETEAVAQVVAIPDYGFAYLLDNHTYGVYAIASPTSPPTRVWRHKKGGSGGGGRAVVAICVMDVDGDGQNELICGYEDGRVEVRHIATGVVVGEEPAAPSATDTHPGRLLGLMAYDYRGDGHMNLIAVNTNGDVRGWVAAPDTDRLQKELQRAPQKRRSRLGRGGGEVDTYATAAEANEAYRSLLREKQTLLKELTSYEANMKALTTTSHEASPSSAGVIPPDTQLTWTLLPNAAEGAVELTLQLSNHCVIRAVVLLGEGLFEGDCCTLHPMPPANNVTVRIAPARNVSTSLSVRAFVGLSASSTQYHLFELEVAFPKFAMYAAVTPDTETFNQYTAMKEESYVVFDAPEEAAKFVGWFEHAFALSPDDRTRVRQALRACKQPGGCAEVVFTSLRPAKDTNDQPGDCLGISLSAPDAAAAAGGGSGLPRVRVVCGDMEALSDVIAHMAEYFKIDQLDTIAHVPQELDRLGGVLGRVEGLQAARAKMTAEMADNSQLVSVCVVVGCQVSVCHQVKSLVLKAEEARILNRMSVAKQLFTQLQQLNQEMVGEYVKRCGNYDALMAELKDLNTSIQRAANLRVGASRTRVVSACRQALKAQNMPELFKVISTGHPSASGAATQNV